MIRWSTTNTYSDIKEFLPVFLLYYCFLLLLTSWLLHFGSYFFSMSFKRIKIRWVWFLFSSWNRKVSMLFPLDDARPVSVHRLMQWCCLSRRTTLCTGPPRTLWMLGSAWEVDPRRLAVITHLTTSRCERERKWEEDNRVDMSSERSRTPGKNECVGVCLPVFVYESGGRAGVHFGGASHDCHRESTANRLLMWRTWFQKKKWKKINSVETLHPSVHKAPPAPQRPRKRLCNRHLYVSKSLCTPPTTSTAAWALQWQHVSTRGSSFPGDRVVLRIIDLVSDVIAESTIAPQ